MLICLTIPCFLALGVVAGCRLLPVKEIDSYGLALIEIEIDPEKYADLNSSVAAKKPVPVRVRWQGRETGAFLSYAGKSTMDHYKKSFDLEAGEPLLWGRRRLRLSAQAMDRSMVRSQLGFGLFEAAGVPAPQSQPAAVYVNDEYAGLYELMETIDEEFFARRGMDPLVVYKATYGNAHFDAKTLLHLSEAFDIEQGIESWDPLVRLIETLNGPLDGEQRMSALQKYVDVDAFAAYLAASVALNNWDGYTNNLHLFWDRATDRFRPLPWDLDRIYEEDAGEFGYRSGQSLWGAGRLFAVLLEDPSFKTLFLAKLRGLLTTHPPRLLLSQAEDASTALAGAFAADRFLVSGGVSRESALSDLQEAMRLWLEALEVDLQRN